MTTVPGWSGGDIYRDTRAECDKVTGPIKYHYHCIAPDAGIIVCDECGWRSKVYDGEGDTIGKQLGDHIIDRHVCQYEVYGSTQGTTTGTENSRF